MSTSRKAQSSMEYLIIISIAVVLIVPTFYFFFTNSQKSTDQAVASQVVRIGDEITKSIEQVYGYGKDAKLTVEFTMPPNVNRVYLRANSDPTNSQVGGKEIVFEINSLGRTNQLVFFSKVPLQVSPNCGGAMADRFGQNFANPGKKDLTLLSCGKNVSLYFS